MDDIKKANYINQLTNSPLDYVYDTFNSIPYGDRTLAISWVAIGRAPHCFDLVPVEVMTEDFVKHAVTLRPDNIAFAPLEYINDNLCFTALAGDADSLRFIPEEKLNHAIYEKAIDSLLNSDPPEVWKNVLGKVPTPEMIMRGGAKMPEVEEHIDSIIKSLSPQQINNDLIEWAIEKDARCFLSLPESCQGYDYATQALSKNGALLGEMPYVHRNDVDLCKTAIQNDKYAFVSSPSSVMSLPFLEWAVETHPDLLGFALKRLEHIGNDDIEVHRRNLSKIAVESGMMEVGRSLPYKDLWLELLAKQRNNGRTDLYVGINPDIMDKEMAKEFLKCSPKDYQFLPRKIVYDPEIAELAVSLYSRNINVVRDDLKTESMFLKAVKDEYEVVANLPERFQHKDFYEAAFSCNPHSFKYIPDSCKSPEMYMVAQKELPDLEIKVPSAIEKGKNIFTFGKLLEKCTGEVYSAQEIKERYGGKPFSLDNFKAMDKRGMSREMMCFDKTNFSFTPIEGIKQKQKMSVGRKI